MDPITTLFADSGRARHSEIFGRGDGEIGRLAPSAGLSAVRIGKKKGGREGDATAQGRQVTVLENG